MIRSDTIKAAGVEAAGSKEMTAAIDLWGRMYQGQVQGGLNLPSAIAGELARLTTIELRMALTGSLRADYLNGCYAPVLGQLRRQMEYALAKGGMVFKPYVDGDTIAVDYIQADSFYPTAFDASGRITGAVFADRVARGSKFYTRLEQHAMTPEGCVITNTAYRSFYEGELGTQIPLTDVAQWAQLQPSATIANISRPLFGYFRTPMANIVDPLSPLGVSVYAKAVDLIEEAEKQYKRLLWEFESGERALYANVTAFDRDREGNPVLPNRRLYRTLDVTDDDLFQDWSPAFREQSLINGLDKLFQRIEFNCGLAYGTLSDPNTVDKTAEEIRSSKQRSYAMVCDIQKALQAALEDLIYAMDVWCGIYKLAPAGKISASFQFDDSIIADRQREFAEKQQLVAAGIMRPWEFRMWYFGEDEATAKGAAAPQAPEAGGEREQRDADPQEQTGTSSPAAGGKEGIGAQP